MQKRAAEIGILAAEYGGARRAAVRNRCGVKEKRRP
jgi:hypothetical protein